MWTTIPILMLGFFPIFRMTYMKGDVTKDLTVTEVTRRSVGQTLEIFGVITNKGAHKWSMVSIEAEFFDDEGEFLDEAHEFIRSEIGIGASEHFKVVVRSPSAVLKDPNTKMKVKVAGGHTSPF